jgi:hypothetical protein
VIREALARLNASIMMNSSIRLWLLGGPVDCTTKTSSPRTFSSILTNVSPSGKALTAHFPISMPMYSQIDLAKGGLEVPLNIFTLRLVFGFERNKNPPLQAESNKT